MKRFLMAFFTVLVCTTLLSLSVAACAEEPIHLIWWTYSASGDAPAALQEVLERANAISAEEIGVTVDLLMKTDSQVSLDLNTGEYYDMIFTCDWYNDFDGNAYLMDMAEAVQTGVREAGHEIPHLKLLAWEPEGDFGKVDLLGVERPIAVTRRFSKPCTDLAVVLNANAACPAAVLDEVIRAAVEEASQLYQLELSLFKKECFNLGE